MLRRSRQEQYAYVIKAYDGEVGSGHPSTGNFRRLGGWQRAALSLARRYFYMDL